MAQQKLDPTVRLLRQVALATILWAATLSASKSEWLRHPAGLPLRIALVAIGIGGVLPIVFVYAKSIRMQDEFNQRIHLVALAIAFAVTAVVSYSSDLLFQAGFIPQVPATGLWGVMVAIWFISMLTTPRFYR